MNNRTRPSFFQSRSPTMPKPQSHPSCKARGADAALILIYAFSLQWPKQQVLRRDATDLADLSLEDGKRIWKQYNNKTHQHPLMSLLSDTMEARAAQRKCDKLINTETLLSHGMIVAPHPHFFDKKKPVLEMSDEAIEKMLQSLFCARARKVLGKQASARLSLDGLLPPLQAKISRVPSQPFGVTLARAFINMLNGPNTDDRQHFLNEVAKQTKMSMKEALESFEPIFSPGFFDATVSVQSDRASSSPPAQNNKRKWSSLGEHVSPSSANIEHENLIDDDRDAVETHVHPPPPSPLSAGPQLRLPSSTPVAPWTWTLSAVSVPSAISSTRTTDDESLPLLPSFSIGDLDYFPCDNTPLLAGDESLSASVPFPY